MDNDTRRVALVTGAAGGIGAAVATRLAADGLDVAVSDVTTRKDGLEDLADQLRASGVRGHVATADVTSEAEVEAMIASTVEALGRLDVMIANAGMCEAATLLDMTPEEWDRTMAVNGRGTFLTYRAAARQMIRQGDGGTIVGAASVAAFSASPGVGHYAASKFAVRALTETAAQEWAPHGITVNAYAPGLVHTAMWDRLDAQIGAVDGLAPGDVISQAVEEIPLGRTQRPEDVAGLVSFLASPDAAYMTGRSVVMDGGMLLG
ncbi:SDR family oxidoreductase [Spiractinospora alimapuensis]|uniref:SDR family oxidoreductase n=1 Tax=Spiractinospora alimapuensis TaxID=2820884 RepID=UPI001F3901CD|nr:SDR family oxidoreductase [Spiractinospora alimapuensis]QVQ52337.1 SDR family oxidoreductase [Spiractinospora alimapuensis]